MTTYATSLMKPERRSIEVGGKKLTYRLPWDSKTLLRGSQDRAIGFDTETELIDKADPAHVPRIALASASDTDGNGFLIHPSQLGRFILAHKGQHLVGHNMAFDFWVVEQYLRVTKEQEALEAWWGIADERLHDTMLFDMLLRLGHGAGFEAFSDTDTKLERRNLDDVGYEYCQIHVNKQDPFRLRYGDLIGFPWELVTETGFWDYAMRDPIVTAKAYAAQVVQAKALISKAQKDAPGHFTKAGMKRWGYLTESLQTRAAITFSDIERRGIRIDPPKALEHEMKMREKLDGQLRELHTNQTQLFKHHKKTGELLLTPKAKTPKNDRKELVSWLVPTAEKLGVEVPVSGGKRGGVSISTKAWKGYKGFGDKDLDLWLEIASTTKALGFFDIFKRENGVLHPRYSVLMRTGRSSCNRPNLQQCFSADTEVLTERGWVTFAKAVQKAKGLKVAQWDNGKVTFVEPEEWISQTYEKDLITLKSDHTDLVVTEDHRCLLRHRKKGKTLRVFLAGEYPEDWEQLHAGMYIGGDSKSMTKEELIFLIAFQADGSWSSGGKGQIEFTVKLPRKISRLRKLFKALGLKVQETAKDGQSKGEIRFVIAPDKFTAAVFTLMGKEKHFGPWLLRLSRKLLDVFCTEIWNWDATQNDASQYASNERVNADWVQTVLCLSGRRAQLAKYDAASGNASWQVHHVGDTDCSSTTGVQRGTVASGGKVFCVTVPSGFILVRRNGRVSVTGNCPRDADFRSFFIPRSGKKFFTVDYSFIELRTLAKVCEVLFGKSVLADVIRAGRDPHTHAASQMLGHSYEAMVEGIKAEKAAGKLAEKEGRPKPPAPFSDARQKIKPITFGVPGGLGPVKLQLTAKASYNVDLTDEEAQEFRERLTTEVYPEMGQYLADQSIEGLARNMGISPLEVRKGFRVEDEDPQMAGRMMRAVSKVIRGNPNKADGTPYKEQFVNRVWDQLIRLTGKSPKLPKNIKDTIRTRQASKRLELVLFAGTSVTTTGRIRGCSTYTQGKNAKFQGLAADGAKHAMWLILRESNRRSWSSKSSYPLVGFIHDEVLVEVDEATAEADAKEVEALLVKGMEEVMDNTMPVAVEGGLGDCWRKG